MPSDSRYRASVRIDLDLTCAHPDELLGASDDERMPVPPKAAEKALLPLLAVSVSPEAADLVRIVSSTATVVDSEWEGTSGTLPPGSSDDARVARTGSRLAGIDWALDELFDADESGAAAAASLRQRTVLKGLIWNASVVIVDCLFDDVVHLATHTGDRSAWRDTHVISLLPSQYATHYDRAFAQRFLAATIEVTSRLTASPVYPPTVAHELALKVVLDEAARGAERLAGDLPERWREHLDTVLFQDLDVESLFVEQDAHTKREAALAVPPLDFASWFIPYAHAPEPAPYANDDIKEPSRS